MIEYAKVLAEQFDVRQDYVENIIALLDEGNTIPFIARYRKEQHGTMDDQTIRRIAERLEYLRGLDARREEVRNAIINQEKMTDEIAAALDKAATLAEIEDIYRPFKQKRRTRASVAKERGLEPLADAIREGQTTGGDPLSMAEAFVDPEKDVPDVQAALAGASDIIAEQISDDAEIRKRIRNLVRIHGILHTVAKQPDENSVYARFDDYSEAVSRIAGHRVLAIDRAEKEEYLRVSIETDPERPLRVIYSQSVVGNNACAMLVKVAGEDAYTRLIYPSVEREIRSELTEAAAEAAIRVFGDNLHQLLMQPPVKGQVTIGLDPGFRSGCKLAVVDATGRVLDTAVIYPTHSATQIEKSKQVLKDKIIRHKATVIAIGNGTASRETEQFTAAVLREIPECQVAYVIVNEAGASV
ncbi:MAG: RNA-binding transcriptional accessory protein, partial [Clostridia bacterium]|nr:RNA-binding transcriptional accessory protein [Clostridia bacterium]